MTTEELRVCEFCGQPIEGQAVESNGHQFCSHGCADEFRRENDPFSR